MVRGFMQGSFMQTFFSQGTNPERKWKNKRRVEEYLSASWIATSQMSKSGDWKLILEILIQLPSLCLIEPCSTIFVVCSTIFPSPTWTHWYPPAHHPLDTCYHSVVDELHLNQYLVCFNLVTHSVRSRSYI